MTIILLVGGLEHFFYIRNTNANWLIFFGGVEPTNQLIIIFQSIKNHQIPEVEASTVPVICWPVCPDRGTLSMIHIKSMNLELICLNSMDWFKGKSTGNHGFLPSNIGLSCKFSHHPILWILRLSAQMKLWWFHLLSGITIKYPHITKAELKRWVQQNISATQKFQTRFSYSIL